MTDYRELAKRHKLFVCERCNYDRYPEILEVHHKDRNRENNTIENLLILCPTCHMEDHFLNKDGKWKIKTATTSEVAI
jgi:5-methylcytosine-specific restriction endonuclease McrA